MNNRPRQTLVIPCYNESTRLPVDEFIQFASQGSGWELIFVDDGSTDNTWDLLLSIVACEKICARAIRLECNYGKAEAVRCGIRNAISDGAQIVAYWDADLATPLNEVERFHAILDRYPTCDIVLGSRIRLMGCVIERRLVRHLLGRVFATAASLILGIPVYDTQCGAKMFRVNPTTQFIFESPFCSRWFFDVEAIGRYLAVASTVKPLALIEVPLRKWNDVAGSKITAWTFITAGFHLLKIWRRLHRLKLSDPSQLMAERTTMAELSPSQSFIAESSICIWKAQNLDDVAESQATQ